jgi:hypothetical protein
VVESRFTTSEFREWRYAMRAALWHPTWSTDEHRAMDGYREEACRTREQKFKVSHDVRECCLRILIIVP